MSIDDSVFTYLMGLRKEFAENAELVVGPPPIKWSRDLVSLDSKDTFILDYYRGEINISKYSFNKRYRTSIVLVRFCSLNRHTNPDGSSFDGPHVHLYKNGYDDRIAHPVSVLNIDERAGIEVVLEALLKYCKVQNIPSIQTAII